MPEGLASGPGPTVSTAEGATRANAAGSGFTPPPELPWSEIGEDFIETWGHDENGKQRHEHMEVEGQSGSGKSYLIATLMQQRAQRFDTGTVGVLTKQSDDSLPLLGWPEVDSFKDLQKYRQALFWPRTTLKGEEREKYLEVRIFELLSELWPDPGELANILIYFDEVRFIEGLSRRLKKMVRMYWREGRSHGISVIAGSQRPLEMARDQHSETRWKAVFAPADEADFERFAQLLGPPKLWEPVLRDLDQTLHQFVLRNSFTKDAFITWIDRELRALASQSAEAQERRRRAA